MMSIFFHVYEQTFYLLDNWWMNLYSLFKDNITSFVCYREHKILCIFQLLFQDYSIKNVVPNVVTYQTFLFFSKDIIGLRDFCEVYQFSVLLLAY